MMKYSAGKIIRTVFLSIFALLSSFSAAIANESAADSSGSADDHHVSHEDLIRGERLFYGLVYSGEKSINCASCHNTQFIDTLNWNPDAAQIGTKYKNKSLKEFSNILLKPRSEKLKQVHADFDLSESDLVQIKAFLDELAVKGIKPAKTTITKLLLFILFSLLVFLSLADLVFFKKLKYKFVHLLILLTGTLYITNTLVKDAIAVGRSQGYSPDQPLKFSHKIHAGQNGTDCLYCHSAAETSKSAGIPATSVCMNCHLIVRNGTRSGAFEIAKLVEYYETGKPIEWIRIYSLPDHAYFNHSQHVGVAGLACQECHGPVEEMDRVIQVSDLSMGWCINCHRERKVEFHDNSFYETYREKADKIKKGEIDSVTVEMIGGTECMKCHY